MRIARESLILGAIGLADLVWTVWVFREGLAVEGNPVMAFYAHEGLAVFVIVKTLLILAPIVALEWVRTRKKLYVERMMRLGIILYLAFYTYGIWKINHQPRLSPHMAHLVEDQINRASTAP